MILHLVQLEVVLNVPDLLTQKTGNHIEPWAAVEFAFFDRDVDRRWINDDRTLILNNISDQCFVNVDNMYRNQR